MKRLIGILLLCVIALSATSCAESKQICWKDGDCAVVQPYGLFNADEKRADVSYRVSPGSVIVGIILCETIVAPIVIGGWFVYEPVGPNVPVKLHDTKPPEPVADPPVKATPDTSPTGADVAGEVG